MSSESSSDEEPVEVVFENVADEESSVEAPMEEWSSLIMAVPEENKKRILFNDGLYHPGSGQLCTKYIPMSDSSVFRHPYYNYPAVLDPGIQKALFNPPEKIVYPDDGQELYLSTCKEMNQCPVKIFYKGLVENEINLRYYCINPAGVRAMTIALSYNRIVKILDLTDNFLDEDACYHLGDLLIGNSCLTKLVLSGCRIGPEGVRRLLDGLHLNRSLKELNLNRNQLGDAGLEHIGKAVFRGIDVPKLHLSYNGFTGKGTTVLAEALETHNKFISLDLSWNNLFSPIVYNLLTKLGESDLLQDLNLAWNSLCGARMGTGIKNLMKARNLNHLDLSNNRFEGEAIIQLIQNLGKAKKLVTLDLSFNPLTPMDALKVLTKLKLPAVKLQRLVMENVFVDKKFLKLLGEVKEMKSRKKTEIIYGGVISPDRARGPDPRELILNRAEFLAKKPKKQPVDVALLIYQLLKDGNKIMSAKSFTAAVEASGAPLDQDLIDEFVCVFSGPSTSKSKTIDLSILAEYIKRKWPERKLPPTPPPEPEPEPVLATAEKGKKGKGKKK